MRLGPSHPVATVCPYCDRANELHAGIDSDERPSPGDAAVCIECGGLCVFDDAMALRLPTSSELPELEQNEQLRAALQVLRDIRDAGLSNGTGTAGTAS